MANSEAMLAESRRLSSMLVRVAECSKAEFAASVAPFGLPVQLARALLLLDNPAPMRELAAQLACDRSYITGLADELEERRLVTRIPGKDRRVKLLALTDAGTALRNQISEAVSKRALVLRRLTEEQRAALAPLLEALLLPETQAHPHVRPAE